MSLPKEPRQKMINMMYLVLTALLALNVSAEILNAFKTVNNSITTSNRVVDDKNKLTYNAFDKALNDPRPRPMLKSGRLKQVRFRRSHPACLTRLKA